MQLYLIFISSLSNIIVSRASFQIFLRDVKLTCQPYYRIIRFAFTTKQITILRENYM